MATIFWGIGPINARPKAEIPAGHEIGPFMVLPQGAVKGRAKDETTDGVPKSIVAMGIKFSAIIALWNVQVG